MTVQRCPGPELLLLAAHDLLDDDDDGGAVRAHLETCDACRRARAALDVALVAPPLPFAPDEVLPELRAKMEAHDALQAPPPSALAGVKLLCTFCKDGLPPPETVYCASCLAPHHADCFGEHGRCAAPGCQGALVVRTAAPPARPPRRRGWLLVASGLLVGGGAVAALSGAPGLFAPSAVDAPTGEVVTTSEPTPTPPPAPTPAPTPEPAVEPASEPDWVADYKRVLASRKVTLNFPGTSLAEVLSFLQDITGLNIVISPEIDAEATEVSLHLKDIPLQSALEIIVDQTGTRLSFENEAIMLRLPGVRRVLEPRHSPAFPPPPLAHAQSAPPLPPELQDAWFAPAATGSEEPGLVRARGYVEQLASQTVTLNFDETPLLEALDFLRDITSLPIRIDPLAQRRCVDAKVSLRLRNITLRNAINLILAATDELVLDVDRDGLLVRHHDSPSLEQRLIAGGMVVEEHDVEVRRQLEEQLVTLNLEATSLEELCDLIRDISGLNLVIESRAIVPDTKITLQRTNVPLREAFYAALQPLGLGLRIESGVLRVVLRDDATLRPDLEPRLAQLRSATLTGVTEPLTPGALAGVLERATGGRVALTERARASRARVRLRDGQTVERALALVERQAGLRHGWSFMSGTDDPVLVLDASGSCPIFDALAQLEQGSPWPAAPASATAALEEKRAELLAALRVLARSEDGLEAMLAASERLRDVLRGQRTLALPDEVPDDVRELVLELPELAAELRRTDDAPHAAQARVAAIEATLADPRLSDDERRDAEAQRVELLRESAVYRRNASLEQARLEAIRSDRTAQLRDLSSGTPAALRACAAARAELGRGRAWDEVFAGGFGPWLEAAATEGVERLLRGVRALDSLDARIGTDDQGLFVESLVQGLPPSGLVEGQRLVAVRTGEGGGPVSTLLDLVDALGAELAPGQAHELATLRGGEAVLVTVPRVD